MVCFVNLTSSCSLIPYINQGQCVYAVPNKPCGFCGRKAPCSLTRLRVKKKTQNPMHVKDPVIHTGSVWWIVLKHETE